MAQKQKNKEKQKPISSEETMQVKVRELAFVSEITPHRSCITTSYSPSKHV